MASDRTPAEPDLPPELEPHAGDERPGDGTELDARGVRDAAWDELVVPGLRLDGVAFAGGDLGGATFVDPAWRDVELHDANLANTTFHSGLVGRVRARGGRLTGLRATETELRDVTMHDASAPMAAFLHATLTRVTFDGCILRQADFMGARCEDV